MDKLRRMVGKLGERREENRRALLLGLCSKRNHSDRAVSLFSKCQFYLENFTVLPGFTDEVTMGWKIQVAFFPNSTVSPIHRRSQQDLKHSAFLVMGECVGFTNDDAWNWCPKKSWGTECHMVSETSGSAIWGQTEIM